MSTIAQDNPIARLPVSELNDLQTFLEPVTQPLPNVRLEAVAELMVRGS